MTKAIFIRETCFSYHRDVEFVNPQTYCTVCVYTQGTLHNVFKFL